LDFKQQIILRTINLIVSYIKNQIETNECNKNLTIWTSVYGDFNKHGLRGHPPIKLKENTIQPMMFNMNY